MNLKSFKSIFRASFNMHVLVVPFVPCPKEGTKRRNMFVEIKNLDNQITSNEYVIETPEEVTYLFSSYQLERGAKRYELANHLGNVLTVISDKKTAICTGNTFNYFAAERISATDYSPFGAPLAGRTWNGGEYRFGFNTQERDDEIAGTGNIMTAQFWEYDTRLGRRWNVDPVIKGNQSGFICFSNSPIMFIDPDGRTDYYNKRGKWIGTDGIDNGVKLMATARSTAKLIKRATKACMVISMNPTSYTDIIQIPNNETMKLMESIWEGTLKKTIEFTMVVGQLDGKEDKAIKTGKEGEAPTGKAFAQFVEAGGSPQYSVHTHHLKSTKNENGSYNISSSEPSNIDIKTAGILESNSNTFNQGGNQSAVIGPSYFFPQGPETNASSLNYTVMISFYNSQNTKPKHPDRPINNNSTMIPNVQMEFKKFTKAVYRANKDYQKRRSGG